MENVYHLPHTFSKKSYTGKSMYDDVFTGPQKFVATSLAPRLEDYSEIFGGFHGSRGRVSSIPVLDLSPVDDVELIVLRSDYSEVFGGFNGVEFASTFEDLVDGANGGYESSDEAWSPAHSGSLSEETDPSACSGRSHSTTSRDKHHPVDAINQFNISFHKAHQTSDGDVTTGMAHITHLEAIPGYTCVVEENVASENNDDEKRPHQETNDSNYKDGFGVRVAEEKIYNKSVSLPMNNDVLQKRESRLNPWETRSKSGPILIEPLITVSDISLRTRPSHLPPPSRPPPVLAAGRGESRITHPKPKTTRSLSVASLEDALCRTEGNLTFSANSSELRDEGVQTYLNLQMEMEEDKECVSTHKDGNDECTAMPSDLGNIVGDAVQWSSDGTYGEIESNSSEKSVKEHRKDHASSLGSSKAEEIVSWREAAEYFEVETDFCRKNYRQSKKETFGNTDVESFGNQWYRKTTTKPKESCDKPRLGKMAPERGYKQDGLNKGESSLKCVPGERRSRETSRSIFQLVDGIDAPETNIAEQRVMHEEIKKVLHSGKHMETQDEDCTQHGNVTDTDLDMKGPSEITETKFLDVNLKKESELVSEEVFEIDHLMKINNESEQTDIEDKANERHDQEEKEKQQNEALGIPRKKKIQKKAHVRIGPKTSESVEQMDEDSSIHHTCKRVDVHHAHEQYKKDGELTLTREAEREIVRECHKLEEDDIELQRSFKEDKVGTEQKEAYPRKFVENLGADPVSKFYEMRTEEALDHERSRTSFSKDSCEEGTRKEPIEANGIVTREKKGEDTGLGETSTQKAEMDELKKNVTKEELDRSKNSPLEIHEKLTHEVQGTEEVSCPVKLKHNLHGNNLGLSRQLNGSRIVVNTAEQGHPVSPTASVNVPEKPFSNVAKIGVASDLDVKVTFPEMQRMEFIAGMQFAVGEVVPMEKLTKPQLASEWVDNAKNISDALQTVLVDIGDIQDDYEADASQGTETKVNNLGGIPLPEEPNFEKQSRNDGELKHQNLMATKEERVRQMEREKDPMAKTQKVGGLKGRELHDEHSKMIEEEREREREREKDRTAVENTIREARERAYVDARERTALERATSETRQRAMTEARERLEKASAEAREARVKAERAAVERATAEARQRAFDKAMSAKCNSETTDRVDRATDKFLSKEMKPRGPTYDSCNIQIQSGLKYTYSSSQVGVEGESPQRCKARLERYQRTANRAAQALAEKNKRDLVAQREQEERTRLAEMLDADVKRWSNGKEGNLRALLSTLQYILGPDSGWQPIPLTEVITSAAVKRAYRKATLCVHPDKLQQRGANTQQKYICEKIFDLLKEAWNKFNSEER